MPSVVLSVSRRPLLLYGLSAWTLSVSDLVEEELRRELVGLRRPGEEAQLEVHVHRAALIPPRIHRRERGNAIRIGDLVPAQELLPGAPVPLPLPDTSE